MNLFDIHTSAVRFWRDAAAAAAADDDDDGDD
jgi:hypothetical protein